MPTLDYRQFDGRQWETGSVANFLAHPGTKAPHTNKPYSEALLLGVSGGIVMGYLSFAYRGFDPHVAILTRNTFDPLDTMLSRLGIVQERRQTTNPDKGLENLLDTLDDGRPAIVWADAWSLPYNALAYAKNIWASFPLSLDDAGVQALRGNIAAHVLQLRDAERNAYQTLRAAMETGSAKKRA